MSYIMCHFFCFYPHENGIWKKTMKRDTVTRFGKGPPIKRKVGFWKIYYIFEKNI